MHTPPPPPPHFFQLGEEGGNNILYKNAHRQLVASYCCVYSLIYIDEEITHSKLNLIQWEKNHQVKNVCFKQQMSMKWKEMGKNLGISDAALREYEGHHLDSMNKVITKWKDKAHEKVSCTNNNNYYPMITAFYSSIQPPGRG